MHEQKFLEIRPRTTRLGRSILHLHTVTSTQEVAWNRGRQGAPEGLVVVADEQTHGHGRKGSAWTNVGRSLYCTVLLRPTKEAQHLSLLPLAAGDAAAQACERLSKRPVLLKWPNDLIAGGKKLGGILVDAVYADAKVPQFVLVGLGVNGDARPEELPPPLSETATSLSIVGERHICLPALLKLYLEALERNYDLLVQGDGDALRRQIRARMGTLGRRVRAETAKGPIEGVARDIGPDGELLVDVDGTKVEVRSGECRELRDA